MNLKLNLMYKYIKSIHKYVILYVELKPLHEHDIQRN